MKLPTPTEIGSALAHFEHYRVITVQEACYPYDKISASVMLGTGFRETGLRNICGGAIWDGEKWVQSYEDRGWLQISDKWDTGWLAKQEGCPEGSWVPIPAGHAASEARHCPRFSPALHYVFDQLLSYQARAFQSGVKSADLMRFCIAAHNAGFQGALDGYREGDVDKHTAQGNYSAYVLALRPLIHNWIVEHPHWVYHPAALGDPNIKHL